MRLHHLDSAKFFLVGLVVVGHLLEQVKHLSPLTEAAYRYVYLFHIPALVFVSGAVAGTKFDVEAGRRLLAALVLPYLVFQALYLYADAIWNDKSFSYRVTTPYWLLWYLFSLAAWRLLLPVLLAVRWPLVLSFVVAVAGGWISDIGYPFSFSRTLVFLPFFVAGHLYGRRRPAGRAYLAWLALLGLAVVAWALRGLSPMWLYGSVGYASLEADALSGAALRAALLALGMIGTWALLRLMPDGNGALMARLGQYSIGAYLLHGFFVRHASAQGWYAPFVGMPGWQILVSLSMLALVMTVLLCLCAYWMRPLLNYDWLWRMNGKSERDGSRSA